MVTPELKAQLLRFQKNEITESVIYRRLARLQGDGENRRILERIADEEARHYELWKHYTGVEVAPDRWRVAFFFWISRILGFTFGVKLMERDEARIQAVYRGLPLAEEKIAAIIEDEGRHEEALIGLLDEERLRYVGSIVLGLNDALVELTGALAGLTLALQNTKLIAMTGSITGIAAAFSMAASEYLSTQTEGQGQHPVKAAVYTGTAYILTVVSLILPYLLIANYYGALACTLTIAVGIIAAFNYYLSVARDQPFVRRFAEMAGLSLGVAGLTFCVGYAVRVVLGVEI